MTGTGTLTVNGSLRRSPPAALRHAPAGVAYALAVGCVCASEALQTHMGGCVWGERGGWTYASRSKRYDATPAATDR